MPLDFLTDEATVLPLRAIVFQVLLLLVAIALEAGILRQRLRLKFQDSIRYAASLNLFTTGIGWIFFLGLEPLAPAPLRTQIMSYILFGQFYRNELLGTLTPVIIALGLGAFFATFGLKLKGLEWLTQMLGCPVAPTKGPELAQRPSLKGRNAPTTGTENPAYPLAILHANALSFSAILILLLLRQALEGWQ